MSSRFPNLPTGVSLGGPRKDAQRKLDTKEFISDVIIINASPEGGSGKLHKKTAHQEQERIDTKEFISDVTIIHVPT